MAGRVTRASPARQTVAAALTVALGVTPLHAQAANPAVRTRDPRPVAPSPRPTAIPVPDGWLADAIAKAAGAQAEALSQAAPAPAPSRGASCAKKLTLFTLLGAGFGVGTAAVLLAATGGSDDTSGIVTRWAVIGVGLGALAGTVSCL